VKILSFAMLSLMMAAQSAPAQNGSSATGASQVKPATPAKVTGHYSTRSRETPNSMEVQQLAGGKIKFHILALWVSAYNRDNVHNGEAQGIVDLKGNWAIYEAEHCKITIRFTRTSAIVKQLYEIGDCDFGANVTATGTYRRTDSRKPKFDF
jgi:hypothetical protein